MGTVIILRFIPKLRVWIRGGARPVWLQSPVLYHYVGYILSSLKRWVGVWLTRKALEFLIYYVLRNVKGLEIGPWEWRKKMERGTGRKVLNWSCNLVVASLALLKCSTEFWNVGVTDWLKIFFYQCCFPPKTCVLTWSLLVVSFICVENYVLILTLHLPSYHPLPTWKSFVSLMSAITNDVR